MRIVLAVILIAILAGVGIQLSISARERKYLTTEMASLKNRLETLGLQNDRLLADIEYYADPRNLEKELRRKFNYREPDEKLLIVVPSH